jgi:hypothetical protein
MVVHRGKVKMRCRSLWKNVITPKIESALLYQGGRSNIRSKTQSQRVFEPKSSEGCMTLGKNSLGFFTTLDVHLS